MMFLIHQSVTYSVDNTIDPWYATIYGDIIFHRAPRQQVLLSGVVVVVYMGTVRGWDKMVAVL